MPFYQFNLAEYILFIILLIPVIYYDIKEKHIPDFFILLGIVVLFSFKIIVYKAFSFLLLFNPVIGFCIIWIIWYFSKGKIGLGDAMLSAYLAMATGLIGLLTTLLLASLSGIIFFLTMTVFKRLTLRESIPFGPFLAGAGIISYLLREPIIKFIMETGLFIII